MSIRARIRRLTMAAAGGAALALGACTSSMLETTEYDWSAGVGNQRCSSGVYYLPKRLLSFQVSLNGNFTQLDFSPRLDADLTPVSDPRLPLCLDYLNAPTADDKVVIDRTSDGLLKSIY